MQQAPRVIAHVDMDAFFAAIEVRERPELAGQPLIVGGRPDSGRGVVATCSYEARRYGVRSAMPIQEARRRCPHAVFLPGRMHLYREVSRRIFAILQRFTPVIEGVSIDEAYLDLTADAHRYPGLLALGSAIKQAIRQGEGLTATVGIASNKFLAKLATEMGKPDGLVVIGPEETERLLPDLELERLPGVGPRTAARLRRLGLSTVADVRRLPRSHLSAMLGRSGENLWQLAWGIDPRPVTPGGEARSMSAEETFEHDLEEPEALRARLAELASEVGRRLRAEGCWARSVTLKARYADFLTVTRRAALAEPTADGAALFEAACRLLERVPPRPGGFRLLGVAAGELARFTQPPLWEEPRHRREQVERLMDDINRRFGQVVVARGQLFKNPPPANRPRPPRPGRTAGSGGGAARPAAPD